MRHIIVDGKKLIVFNIIYPPAVQVCPGQVQVNAGTAKPTFAFTLPSGWVRSAGAGPLKTTGHIFEHVKIEGIQ